MKRKDGRELVTEHPVTGMDMIDYVTDVEIPEGATACYRSREPDDFDIGDWGA